MIYGLERMEQRKNILEIGGVVLVKESEQQKIQHVPWPITQGGTYTDIHGRIYIDDGEIRLMPNANIYEF